MKVYLDNSATTKPYKVVLDSILKYNDIYYANPSSVHKMGVFVYKDIKNNKQEIAKLMNVEENEIIFTSGGTESTNMVLRGLAFKFKNKKNHIISSNIEHPSTYETLEFLSKNGFEITYLKVNEKGVIDFKDLKNAIKDETFLVSIMHANNEVGSLMPIEKIGRYLKKLNQEIYFHVDAVQSFLKLSFKPKRYNIDFMSISGHKIHGPKGIGILFKDEKLKLEPLLTGGGQQNNLRSGTENTSGIVGICQAIIEANKDFNKRIEHISKLKDYLKKLIVENIEDIKINTPNESVCHILNISFLGIKGEILLHALEQKGIYVSTGSACSSKKKKSRVLQNMGLKEDEIEGAIRFSLSEFNTKEEMEYVVDVLNKEVSDLRSIINKK